MGGRLAWNYVVNCEIDDVLMKPGCAGMFYDSMKNPLRPIWLLVPS